MGQTPMAVAADIFANSIGEDANMDDCGQPAFDAIGILLQESGSDSDGTFGHELFVQEIAPSSPAVLSIASRPVVTWPGALANYHLQYTNTVGAPGPWQPATNVPALINGRWTVILDPADAQTRFYRLQRIQ